MTVVILVCTVDECLQLGHIVRIGKVNNVDGDVVLAETLAKSLEFALLLLKRVSAEGDDALPLRLVHAVLERELRHLDRGEEIGLPIFTQKLVKSKAKSQLATY